MFPVAPVTRIVMIFTLRRPHDTIAGVKAVLWDMDGTLVDSEKLWDVSLAALYEKLGGELTPAVRASMVGSVAENTMRIVYTDLGLDLDPDGDGRVQPLAERLHRKPLRRWLAVV